MKVYVVIESYATEEFTSNYPLRIYSDLEEAKIEVELLKSLNESLNRDYYIKDYVVE